MIYETGLDLSLMVTAMVISIFTGRQRLQIILNVDHLRLSHIVKLLPVGCDNVG